MFSFEFVKKNEIEAVAPSLFRILSDNMGAIAPTGNTYDKDYQMWSSYVLSDSFWTSNRQIILMLAGDEIIGYFQYCIVDDTLTAEEIEIARRFQRTALFGRFLRFAQTQIPTDVKYIEAYVNKLTANSQRITSKLGLKIIGENKNGKSWRYRGALKDLAARMHM